MNLLSNYGPISLISQFSKFIEKLMHSRLMDFLEKYSLLYKFQFGFRRGYSTNSALIDVVDLIETETTNKNFVLGIFLDFKKAFDTVDFDILVHKLNLWYTWSCPSVV